jgi:hypothetical protein
MRTVKLHVLCEGQTELRFASKVLTTYWIEKGIIVLPETAPSKRIIKALKDKYHYDKPKTGTEITDKIGIDTLRAKCQHFNEWLTKIENTCK